MLSIGKWFIKYFGNFLSVFSIVITVYFGAFYVPGYFKDAQKQKIENSKNILEQTIKELIFSDSTATTTEIQSLVQAQEISLEQSLPLTTGEILTNVQNSFMQDKFLPLSKRRALAGKIEIIKNHLPKNPEPHKSSSLFSILLPSALSIIITIVVGWIGLLSAYRKYKQDKQVEEEIDSVKFDIDHIVPQNFLGSEYESAIFDIIKAYPGVEMNSAPLRSDSGFDIEFSFKKKRYYVEIKYLTRNKLGLNSFREFLYMLNGLEGEFWYIHNMDLTSMVQSKFEEFKEQLSNKRVIKFLKVIDPSEFKSLLKSLLNNE